jgi:D-amino peptidase
MKAFMMTDLEGVAGVASFYTDAYAGSVNENLSRHLLTQEVNACIDGLRAGGVDTVIVMDGHGASGILFEELHAEARLVHGRPLSPTWADLLEGCDVSLFVGQHAMAGTPGGNMNHTQDSQSITSFTLNGRAIGEIAQFVLLSGTYGVPVVFLSGDAAACREIEALVPGVTTAAVKEGIGRSSAVSLSAVRSRELIRERARQALASHAARPVAPLTWPGPYVLEKRFFTMDRVEEYQRLARRDPAIEIVDALTVRIRGTDLRAMAQE